MAAASHPDVSLMGVEATAPMSRMHAELIENSDH